MDDNDLVHYDDRPLLERFTRAKMPLDFKYAYGFPENNHIKTIIRGGLDNVSFMLPHNISERTISCCNCCGNECQSDSAFNDYNFDVAYLKHFSMKTIDEYVNGKLKRGTADRNYGWFLQTYRIDDFFKINERTPEKEEVI